MPQTNTKIKSVKLLAILAQLVTNVLQQLYLNAVSSITASLVKQFQRCATLASTHSRSHPLLFQIARLVQPGTSATVLATQAPRALIQTCPPDAMRSVPSPVFPNTTCALKECSVKAALTAQFYLQTLSTIQPLGKLVT